MSKALGLRAHSPPPCAPARIAKRCSVGARGSGRGGGGGGRAPWAEEDTPEARPCLRGHPGLNRAGAGAEPQPTPLPTSPSCSPRPLVAQPSPPASSLQLFPRARPGRRCGAGTPSWWGFWRVAAAGAQVAPPSSPGPGSAAWAETLAPALGDRGQGPRETHPPAHLGPARGRADKLQNSPELRKTGPSAGVPLPWLQRRGPWRGPGG